MSRLKNFIDWMNSLEPDAKHDYELALIDHPGHWYLVTADELPTALSFGLELTIKLPDSTK